MYEELVRRLRSAESNYQETLDCLSEAADAIEQLSNAGSAYGRGWTIGYDAGREESKPRWIPVTERLPEEPYGCMLIVWDSPYDGGDDFLNYLPYFAGWDGKQWNDGDGQRVPFEVAFWMPLPEPPKEESNGV